MHLTSLSIRKLHGALTLDVSFRSDVTLLVGINGSGKTSVLNCIEVLLRPDMRRLATLDYERLTLAFEREGATFNIVATKNSKRVTLSLEGGSEELQPITINLLQGIDTDDDDATEHYTRLGPEKHERPLWDFLKSLPHPIVITLDRTIAAEADDSIFFEENRPSAVRRARIKSPLSYVQEVTSASYAAYRKRAIAADDELKAEIVMSALQEPDFLTSGRSSKPLTASELGRLQDKVISYLSKTVKSGDVARQVRAFFQSSSRIAAHRNHQKLQQDLVLDMVGSRYRQIESLAKAFNNYEKKNASAFGKLSEYLDTVNGFFRDSNKELFFEESTGRLVFSFLREGERVDARRGIKHLSSGERQVLILFTFLAFASTSSKVFIVDEPELSLHPKWQHEFMDAFLRLKPKEAQVLLATHSPEIVGKHKSACVALKARER
jgi:energy-coupling factor transporter ATP-binding protein EcfA2